MKPVHLQGFSHQGREALLTALIAAVDGNDGCVLGQRSLSLTTEELRLEVQRYAVPNFYAGVVGTGLELTRVTHQAMAGLCTCSQEMFADTIWTSGSVVEMELQVSFLENLSMDSFPNYSSTPA